MAYSFFVTNVVVPDFEPILRKNGGRFWGGADTKNPEKARRIKKIQSFGLVFDYQNDAILKYAKSYALTEIMKDLL